MAPAAFIHTAFVSSTPSSLLPRNHELFYHQHRSCSLFSHRRRPRHPRSPTALCNNINDISDTSDPAIVPDTDSLELRRRQTAISGANLNIPVPPPPTVVEVSIAPGKTLRFETGRLARQAAGAVLLRHGDTMVFSTACADPKPSPSADFLPLRVDYSEKFSAFGKTSGSYVKREGRPSEREILISRLIDRPLRPMFADGYFNEVQVLSNVFSYDGVNQADALSICSAAAALHISSIPLVEPVAGVRIAYIDDQFILEPTVQETKRASAELVVAGTAKGVLMLEGYASFLDDDSIIAGVRMAHKAITLICSAIDELREKTGARPKDTETLRVIPSSLLQEIHSLALGLDEALATIGKKDRDEAVGAVQRCVFDTLKPSRESELADPDGAAEQLTILRLAWKQYVSDRMRQRILDTGVRPDGRDVCTVRPITIDPSFLPGTHGSALFTRGETQTLAVATLGGEDMAQRFETLEGENASRFYLQYSFPPFSVGEVGRIGAPGRREVGHGKLAERALLAAIPSQDDFPYVMRIESNILESNGSSSMASVCGGCLALFDAGVPLSCSVAGVAMGLIVDKSSSNGKIVDDAVVLTDILGLEDALGSCDAKFAGNRSGWSALQLDVKLRGISINLFERLLKQAGDGRDYILDQMDAVVSGPNPNLADTIPKVEIMSIPVKKIGDLIGPGGKVIKSIIDKCGGDGHLRISVDPEGKVSLTSVDTQAIAKARLLIAAITVNVEVGTVISGTVTKVLPFGAYIEIAQGKEGWLHISDIEHKRTENVDDVCKIGEKVKVKVMELGRNGQVKLSRKACIPRDASSPLKSDGTVGPDDEKLPREIRGKGSRGASTRKMKSEK